MHTFGQKVAVNVRRDSASKGTQIDIVGGASNEAAWRTIQAALAKGSTDELKLTLLPGYTEDRFQTALLRSAYLILFQVFGYHYVRNRAVQELRRRISDPSLRSPDLATLIGAVQESSIVVDNDYYIVHGFMDDVPFFQVVIRHKRGTESRYFVMMPVPHKKEDQFFRIAAKVASENATMTIKNIPHHAIFTDAVQEGDSL